jgi:hypothetical protein
MSQANKAVLAIIIIGISVFLGFTPLYEKVQGGVAGAVIGASFGAIFVVILTNYLLTKQTEVEQESKRSERVFEEKVNLYKQILTATELMLEDGYIKGSEEMKRIPFLMLRLQMLGNDEAIKSYQNIYHQINNIFIAEPGNDEVEVSEESFLKLFQLLGDFCNVCRLDLKVSDQKIDTKLFNIISEDIKKSNEILLGKVNENISEIHDHIMKLDKTIDLKAIKRDYIAWQLPNWPTKVEYQVVTRVRDKKFIVQISAEGAKSKYVAEKLENLLPLLNTKFPNFDWHCDTWYSDYNNRVFTNIDISEPEKAAALYLQIINETKNDVDNIVMGK